MVDPSYPEQRHLLLSDSHQRSVTSTPQCHYGSRDEESCSLLNSTSERTESDNDEDDGSSHEIGYIGSFAIAINSLAGPAVLQLPFQYQQSGFVATTLGLCGVAVLSVACSLYICRVVEAIPASAKIDRPVELSSVVGYFWNRRAYLATQWLFFACTFCLNVAAMIDTAQVVDTAIGVSGLATYGFSPSWGWLSWSHPRCSRKQVKLGHCDPFVYQDGTDSSGPILTLGYLITAAVFCPLCLMDLKENTAWQIGGCFLLLTLCGYFCFAFLTMNAAMVANAQQPTITSFNQSILKEEEHYNATVDELHFHRSLSGSMSHKSNLGWWGNEYRDLLGVILFNFALVLALPAWLHTKKSNVKVSTIVYGSTLVSTLLYIGVGTVVAVSIPQANVNMLAPMVSGAFGSGIQAASSLFCFFIIGLDIPLFCVLTRYNLSKLLPNQTWLINALVVYIPWGMSWLFYQGDAIATLLDWGGVLLTSAIAFLLPLYLAYRVLRYTDLELVLDHVTLTGRRRDQLRCVVAWLGVTAVAVALAIAGQAAVQAEKYQYLHSPEYLNDTSSDTPPR